MRCEGHDGGNPMPSHERTCYIASYSRGGRHMGFLDESVVTDPAAVCSVFPVCYEALYTACRRVSLSVCLSAESREIQTEIGTF